MPASSVTESECHSQVDVLVNVRTTTPDLHITADIITVGFVRTDSNVSLLSVMSLKMKKKMIGAGLKPTVKDYITAGL